MLECPASNSAMDLEGIALQLADIVKDNPGKYHKPSLLKTLVEQTKINANTALEAFRVARANDLIYPTGSKTTVNGEYFEWGPYYSAPYIEQL